MLTRSRHAALRSAAAAGLLTGLAGLVSAGAAQGASVDAMKASDAAAYTLTLQGSPTRNATLDRLRAAPRRSIPQVLDDANRSATPVGSRSAGDLRSPPGFFWQKDGPGPNPNDQDTKDWYPQGLTGSGDAQADGLWAGRRLFVTSWYRKASEKDTATIAPGVRVSFSTAEDLATSRYRHALLVRPTTGKRQASFAPVKIHAGGIAWFKRWLYVADTDGGLRVFDMLRIRQVDDRPTTKVGCSARRCRAAGYKYVVPQVAKYRFKGPELNFSAVSLDRSTPTPSLSVVEYRDGKDGAPLVRWDLDPQTGLLQGAGRRGQTARASGGWRLNDVTNAQGAITLGGRVAISTSAGKGNAGILWRGTLGGTVGKAPWVAGGEDLTWAPGSQRLYTATEWEGDRGVIGRAGF